MKKQFLSLLLILFTGLLTLNLRAQTPTITLSASSGANVLGTNITASQTIPIGFTMNDLSLQMTGTLPVGKCIYLYIRFTVNVSPTGTTWTNTATFVPLANNLTIPPKTASFVVEAGQPVPCLLKEICPQPSPSDYSPGQIVRFRLLFGTKHVFLQLCGKTAS